MVMAAGTGAVAIRPMPRFIPTDTGCRMGAIAAPTMDIASGTAGMEWGTADIGVTELGMAAIAPGTAATAETAGSEPDTGAGLAGWDMGGSDGASALAVSFH